MLTLEDVQGMYEISYQSTPPMDDWFESGFGSAQISGNKLTGIDGLGVEWQADLVVEPNGTIKFSAVLDPANAPGNVGLMDANGAMSKNKQFYSGVLKVTNVPPIVILRTTVFQGPLTINVQFKKLP